MIKRNQGWTLLLSFTAAVGIVAAALAGLAYYLDRRM